MKITRRQFRNLINNVINEGRNRRVISESEDEEWWVNYKSGNKEQQKQKVIKRVKDDTLPDMKERNPPPRVYELQRALKLAGELKKHGERRLAKELEREAVKAGKERGLQKTAIISGVCGQDGSYLAELMLKNGYTVVGLI